MEVSQTGTDKWVDKKRERKNNPCRHPLIFTITTMTKIQTLRTEIEKRISKTENTGILCDFDRGAIYALKWLFAYMDKLELEEKESEEFNKNWAIHDATSKIQ